MDLFEGDADKEEKVMDLLAVVRHMPRVSCHVNCYTNVEKLDDEGKAIGVKKEKNVCASDYI